MKGLVLKLNVVEETADEEVELKKHEAEGTSIYTLLELKAM